MNIDDNLIKTKIFDSGGQERFKDINKLLYRGTHAFFLMYDITNLESFENIKLFFLSIKECMDAVIILLGSKCDLKDNTEVSKAEGKKFADENGFIFMEISAKLNINITEAYLALTNKLMNSRKEGKNRESIILKNISKNEKKKCC